MKVILIAGQGFLPVEALKKLRSDGHEVVVFTFAEEIAKDMSGMADDIRVFSVGQVGKILKNIKSSGADALAFAGKFNRWLLEKNLKFDLKALWILARLRDRQEDTIMLAIIDEIIKLGVSIIPQDEILSHLLPGEGVYSKKKPSAKQMEDIVFGYEKVKGIAALDIGQSIIVKRKSVLATEAIEGTDLMILRGASYANNGGYTLVKVAKPMQDVRFDIPVIGMDTMKNIVDTKGAVVAFEANKTLILELDKCVKFADEHGIVFMGYSPAGKS